MFRKIFRCGAVGLLLGSAHGALAQSDFWTGTWKADYAELRLKENGNFVYGDYGDYGVIEGIKVRTATGEALRARFTRKDGAVGYMEWVESGDDGNRFTGRWVYEGADMPSWDDPSLTRWRGTRIDDDAPTLKTYDGNGMGASMLASAKREYRVWVDAPDMDADDPWTGTWDTNWGPIRLISRGGYVHGDYGNRGTIHGVSRKVGDAHILRARYTRNDDGSTGYIEWKSDGKSDHTLDGKWAVEDGPLPSWDGKGQPWNATRTNAARPRLTTYSGSYGQQAILGSKGKFRNWVQFKTKAARPVDTSGAAQSNALTRAEHPWAEKMPIFAGRPASFKPRYIEFRPVRIHMTDSESGFENATVYSEAEIYGVAGLYFTCQTDAGSRQIAPYGGVPNRFFDIPRNRAIASWTGVGSYDLGEKSYRRFRLDEDCINSDDGRLRVQLQSNMKEKDNIPASDEEWGFRSSVVHLDEVETDDKNSGYSTAYMYDRDTMLFLFDEQLDAKKGLLGLSNPTVVFAIEGHFIE